jgi:hypothetical protein
VYFKTASKQSLVEETFASLSTLKEKKALQCDGVTLPTSSFLQMAMLKHRVKPYSRSQAQRSFQPAVNHMEIVELVNKKKKSKVNHTWKLKARRIIKSKYVCFLLVDRELQVFAVGATASI